MIALDTDPLVWIASPSEQIHRVLRRRKRQLKDAAEGVQSEEQTELWSDLTAAVDVQIAKADAERIKVAIGKEAGSYLTSRTALFFQNPAILALGLGDEKGGAVETAKELVAMVEQRDTKIGLLRRIADHLHTEVDAEDVRRAVFEDDEYDGICCIMRDEYWPLVEKLAADGETNPKLCLSDNPEFRPLRDLIRRCGKDVLSGNAISEINGKAVVRTLLPEMRRKADTARRRASTLKPWHKEVNRGLSKLLGFPKVDKLTSGVTAGEERWQLMEASEEPEPFALLCDVVLCV